MTSSLLDDRNLTCLHSTIFRNLRYGKYVITYVPRGIIYFLSIVFVISYVQL